MQAHPRKITVAPGKAYTAEAFSPQLTEGIHRRLPLLFRTKQQLSETEGDRVLVSAQTLLLYGRYDSEKCSACQDLLFSPSGRFCFSPFSVQPHNPAARKEGPLLLMPL